MQYVLKEDFEKAMKVMQAHIDRLEAAIVAKPTKAPAKKAPAKKKK